MQDGKNQGIIRMLKYDKGYGFIRSEDGNDFFFHMTNCNNDFFDLKAGDIVSFTDFKTDRGAKAVDVSRIKKAT